MNHKKDGRKERSFTLIELIMVIVIIGILVLVALPRYYANVGKATKAQIYANLSGLKDAMLAYYAVYGAWPADSWSPSIIVTVDGETFVSIKDPSNSAWIYGNASTGTCTARDSNTKVVIAWKLPGWTCNYALCTDGYAFQSCTP